LEIALTGKPGGYNRVNQSGTGGKPSLTIETHAGQVALTGKPGGYNRVNQSGTGGKPSLTIETHAFEAHTSY